ncbi:HlyD family secretion protein [Pyxidicoccus parkwayensis]|uniref:HlyD family secretion protein n=1 Tax=Pyxidicoccus parkwayensis TaxID=2813578 RepID=A0ABX7P0S3_9BACT|nr:HlyD family efflux transporter periplasmic adaptor subunit [Pyxidicoccus parkwaysis]QSQ23281.1 HlyD family secretion protein [Pyxidicoccus parkwaysis]
MSADFSHSLRALREDGFRRPGRVLIILALFTFGWLAWFIFARVTVYEVSENARLEVDRAVFPVEAQVDGRVLASHLDIGRRVEKGDVLLELDSNVQRLKLQEEQARLDTLLPQLETLQSELAAQRQALGAEGQAASSQLSEAQANKREAQAALSYADEEQTRFKSLAQSQVISQLDYLKTKAEREKRRAALDAVEQEADRLHSERLNRKSQGMAQVARLERELASMQGLITTTKAHIATLTHDLELFVLRAPASGQIGEVARLQPGSEVKRGDPLAVLVPPGQIRVVADFKPSDALGHIRPGQTARMRMQGFPWAEYGVLNATVSRLASEARDGKVRVECELQPDGSSRIPRQHGLPGSLEVAVDDVSPAALILREAGQRLGAQASSNPPTPTSAPPPGGGS